MREIKFRGQRVDNFQFVAGCLINYLANNNPRIVSAEFTSDDYAETNHEVIPETVGQYTGLKDKNGVEIYEGDIVKVLYNQNSENYAGSNFQHTEHICIVEFSDYSSSFVLRNITEKYKGKHNFTTIKFDHRRLYKDRIEVIGNIHSNPELLK